MKVSQKARLANNKRAGALQRQLSVWDTKQKFYMEQPDSAQRIERLAFIAEQISKTQKELRSLSK